MFTTTSGVVGGTQAPGSTGSMGLNVLLHGDGGKSFIAFPNQIVQDGLMGVVVLAPSEQLLWGQHKGPPGGLSRPDGVVDAQAVRDLVAEVLPHYVAFDPQHVFFTGVSGGSLLLSGFFMPAHMADFGGPGSGVLLLCGGMQPQVPVAGATAWAASTRIHHQSSQRELSLLQPSIPQAVRAYEALARQQGLNATAVGALQTVDNTPAGGHCVFDGITYNSGIQLFMDHFADVMQGGNGSVPGIDTPSVLKTVVGNEDLRFAGATKSRQSVSFEA